MKVDRQYRRQGFVTGALLGVLGFLMALPNPAFAIKVDVAEAPEDNLALTLKAIRSAQKSLFLNIYELTSDEISKALSERIAAGVQVDILEEGEPVGGVSQAKRNVQRDLVRAFQKAGQGGHFYEMTSKALSSSSQRRFRFDHAKYAVIDGEKLLVGSENYSPTGHPRPPALGNRGWEVFVYDRSLAAHFTKIFKSDSDLSHGDVIDLTQLSSRFFEESVFTVFPDLFSRFFFPSSYSDLVTASSEELEPLSDSAAKVEHRSTFEASSVLPITAPNTSLKGMLDFLNSATETLDLELMSFNSNWYTGNLESNAQPVKSPLFEAIVEAGRRGVRVRVLLNDESVFSRPHNSNDPNDPNNSNHWNLLSHFESASRPKNKITADALNQVAAREGLKIVALIADVKAMGVTYIHNKGGLADRNKTFVSSINWNSSAIERNREAAVLITSPEIHDHYLDLFEKDWKASGGTVR